MKRKKTSRGWASDLSLDVDPLALHLLSHHQAVLLKILRQFDIDDFKLISKSFQGLFPFFIYSLLFFLFMIFYIGEEDTQNCPVEEKSASGILYDALKGEVKGLIREKIIPSPFC